MQVLFKTKQHIKTPFSDKNRIELYPDVSWESSAHPWDDFGYKTSFQATLYYDNKEYELPNIKILIDTEDNTHSFFKTIIEETRKAYILFPLDNIKYISLPTDTEFYNVLYSLFKDEKQKLENILIHLHDASYIEHTDNLQEFKFLMESKSDGFNSSLIRDMTSKKALEYGWLIVENRTLGKNVAFELNFQLENFVNEHNIEINFKDSIFPQNINVLIGSNGTGKSQTLTYLINELLGLGTTQQLKKIPVFNQIVVIAYSPFEDFLVSLKNTKIKIKSVYKYFGFRDEDEVFHQKLPFINSVDSIISIIKEDDEKDFFIDRPNKFETFINVIKKAIDFDFIGFEIEKVSSSFQPLNDNIIIDDIYYIIKDKNDFLTDLSTNQDKILKECGIVFCKNNKVINLSSGQQIFAHLISSIISSIREDTILLIDEPELYLHPNLEVELIELLKELLDIYKSYAIIATHSSIVAREVSKDYITVLKKRNNEILISKPPFETFGGDIEKINSYVFFDKDIEKPYEKWLQKLVNKAGGSNKAIEEYKSQLNEESLIFMYGMSVTNAN